MKNKEDYAKIEIDRKAVEASKSDVGFKQYIYNGQRIIEDDRLRDLKIYMMDTQKMFIPSWDVRRHVKPLTRWQKIKNYFSHVCYALRGYDCD